MHRLRSFDAWHVPYMNPCFAFCTGVSMDSVACSKLYMPSLAVMISIYAYLWRGAGRSDNGEIRFMQLENPHALIWIILRRQYQVEQHGHQPANDIASGQH